MLLSNRGVTAFLLCLGFGLTVTGCSEPSDSCALPSDCPAGHTCSDGRCLPVLKGDAGRPDGELSDSSPPGDSALPDALVWPDLEPTDGGCTGNQNGMIERNELQVVVPSSVSFVLGTNVQLNLAGSTSGGQTVWDLTGSATDDKPEPAKLDPVPAWAAADFPDATYIELLDRDLDTYGVYKMSQTKMELLGAISEKQDYGSISYGTPVELLRFPVQPQDSYSTKTFATGTWGFTVISNWETYDVEVVGSGKVKLPKITFDTVLVRIEVTQYPYGNPFFATTKSIFLFLSECYGRVARVVVDGSPTDLTQVTAEERWRLSTP